MGAGKSWSKVNDDTAGESAGAGASCPRDSGDGGAGLAAGNTSAVAASRPSVVAAIALVPAGRTSGGLLPGPGQFGRKRRSTRQLQPMQGSPDRGFIDAIEHHP
jgi:hypothetical protein